MEGDQLEPVSLKMAFEECEVEIPELERNENLIAAAKHIVRALGSKKSLTNDAKKVLADLGKQLSSMTKSSEEEEEEKGVSAFEDRLIAVEEIIMRWEEDQSMIWDCGLDEASEYLNAAGEVYGLIEKLGSLHLTKYGQKYKFLHRAYGILQKAMARLQEVFRNLLTQNRQSFEPKYVSFRSDEEDIADERSVASLGDGSFEESFQRDSVTKASEEHTLDLVNPDVIPHLRCIADFMITCNYDQECSHAYIVARRDALDECFLILEIERLSIENVLKMECGTLNSIIKRWIWAVKIFVRVYLASERWLSEQIFGEGEPVSLVCFVDASKASILKLMNFGEAMYIGPHQPEKLFKILDMYEVLASLLPDIDALYSDEVGSSVRLECHEVLKRLGDCVRATFLEFKNGITSNASSTPLAGGGIHHLTRYVMNYVTILTDYSKTLDLLLKDQEEQQPDAILLSPDMILGTEEDNKNHGSTDRVSSMALHFRSITSILECNLHEKSKLYKEVALQHLFLMNNIHYMAQKVEGSELRMIYGDEWIRKCNFRFRQHAMNYERTTLSSILSLLKDEGIQMPGSNSISKSLVIKRLRSFTLAFEDLYRIQTSWCIPDIQLREELQISLAVKIIPAYRSYIGRYRTLIYYKNIKYTLDDLENYLFDFFEGAPKSLQNPQRRWLEMLPIGGSINH